jgi:hypothetical protein
MDNIEIRFASCWMKTKMIESVRHTPESCRSSMPNTATTSVSLPGSIPGSDGRVGVGMGVGEGVGAGIGVQVGIGDGVGGTKEVGVGGTVGVGTYIERGGATARAAGGTTYRPTSARATTTQTSTLTPKTKAKMILSSSFHCQLNVRLPCLLQEPP